MVTNSSAATGIVVTPYTDSEAAQWDSFVRSASNGTFLHTRRYLSYHRDRFKDASLLLHTSTGELVGVLPAARANGSATPEAVSHPGITFGGLLCGPTLRGERLVSGLAAILGSLHASGFATLVYRPVPAFVRGQLGDEDVYAAYRLGAERDSCHLSAIVDLARRPHIKASKRNKLSKAQRSELVLQDGVEWLPPFWELLADQLKERYGAVPVHTLEEMTELAQLFPDEIGLRVATIDEDAVVAGAVTYRYTDDVIHTQYLSSNAIGRQTAALDLLCDSLIRDADAAGRRYVSFGTSSHDDGSVLNDSLYQFKHSFGATGFAIESYRIPCRAP